jgi:hypothetical protein
MCHKNSVLASHFITCVNKTNSLLSSQVTAQHIILNVETYQSAVTSLKRNNFAC